MAEWFIALILKINILKNIVGSNPTPALYFIRAINFIYIYIFVIFVMNQLNVNITINEFNVFVKKNTTIIQACLILRHKLAASDNGKELEIPGNCRMCLVELIKSPKPVVACALQVNDNMVIKTDTILVKKAREGVLEFFLINHPLDCPVCDQGGECDLQDQIDVYCIDKS